MRLIALVVVVGVLVAACSSDSGDGNNPGLVDTTPSNSASPKPTEVITAPPTPEPTPAPTEAPVIPTYDEMKASVYAGFFSYGSSEFPGSIYNIEVLDETLDICNGVGPSELSPNYGLNVLGGCGNIGATLVEIKKISSTPEIDTALARIREYTLGAGGRLDQLLEGGKLPEITNVENYRKSFDDNFFNPELN